jgi:hypothetical protein
LPKAANTFRGVSIFLSSSSGLKAFAFCDGGNQFRTADDPPSSPFFHQYARGYQAINTLFPAALGYAANSLNGGTQGALTPVTIGNLDIRSSTIQTQQGGTISITRCSDTLKSTAKPMVRRNLSVISFRRCSRIPRQRSWVRQDSGCRCGACAMTGAERRRAFDAYQRAELISSRMAPRTSPFYSNAEAAALLHLSPRTLERCGCLKVGHRFENLDDVCSIPCQTPKNGPGDGNAIPPPILLLRDSLAMIISLHFPAGNLQGGHL